MAEHSFLGPVRALGQEGTLPILRQEPRMAKTGRNDSCPCGSGNKYKRCCLPKHEAEARLASPSPPRNQQTAAWVPVESVPGFEDDNLDELSNRVVDLVKAGKLDEAEAAVEELKREYPDVIDCIERPGMIHEARGEKEKAIASYEQCLVYIDHNPELFEGASRERYHRLIGRLRGDADRPTDVSGQDDER